MNKFQFPKSSLKSESSSRRADEHCRFGQVSLRLYPMTLGDNPCTKLGPPVQIDWVPLEQYIMSLDDFEKGHEKREAYFLASGTRLRMLKELGYSEEECMKATELAKSIANLRASTIANLKYAWKEEKAEEKRKKRQEFFSKFGCAAAEEDIVWYPSGKTIHDPEFWEKHQTQVKPMFDHIPCTHCAAMVCMGPGCDLPAQVGMFKCDGVSCRKLDGSTCPFTGKPTDGKSVELAPPSNE